MRVSETVKLLESGTARTLMARLYGEGGVEASVRRYEDLLARYKKMFGKEGDVKLFSSPGKMEISGNHTDYNHDKVLAGSINLDCMEAAGTNESNQVHIVSETYDQDFTIDLSHLEPSKKKAGTVDLVKGLLQGFRDSDYHVGGFSTYITNNAISAAGVSSSASFGMLLYSILNTFFNEDRMSTVAYTHIDKFAENSYWDKASGLLDQMACAVGDLTTTDFVELPIPKVKKIDFDFGSQNYNLIIVQTDKDHANPNADYSSIPAEMKKVTRYLGKKVLSQISEEQVIDNLAEVRQFAEDRSILRALYLSEENKRVEAEALALRKNRLKDFLNNITASGSPSWKWPQNCFTDSDYQEQGITVTPALTELFVVEKQKGACRVHRGGFAGVIMAVLLSELVNEFIHYIGKYTGEGSTYQMSIRPYGTICFNDLI